ncbi:MAG: alcohol dehydrogenase catalytic domain-containing protein [Desulfobacterales bacterium]|nr:alcohol dehydrogenase catalytic domain-containing protein [Desulfobacterales bacterium]
MKAIVYQKEGGLTAVSIPRPVPEADQVLVRVVNVGFCGSDHSLVESGQLADGTILGHEVSGVVAGLGRDVTGVAPGDRVIVRPTFCGQCRDCAMGKPQFCQVHRRLIGLGDLPGAFAEYICVFPSMLIPVPDMVDDENAALAEPFAVALHGIRISGRSSGSVLVMGGGPIGLALLKLLVVMGFGPIALSEPKTEKRELASRFGAHAVFDPLAGDLNKEGFLFTGGVGFETVFECSGVPANLQAAAQLSARGGSVCVLSVIFSDAVISPATLTFKEITLCAAYGNTHEENRQCLAWMAEGRLDGRDLITHRIGLEDLPDVYRSQIHTGLAVKVMIGFGEAGACA